MDDHVSEEDDVLDGNIAEGRALEVEEEHLR